MITEKVRDPNSLESRIRKQERIVEKRRREYEKAKSKLDGYLQMRKRRREAVKKRIEA